MGHTMGRQALWLFIAAAVVASTVAEDRATRCKSFCDRAMKHCRGDDAAYDDRAECDRECWLTRIEQMIEQSGRIAPGTCDYVAVGGGMCDASVPHDCDAYCGQISSQGDCGRGPWNFRRHEDCSAACAKYKQDAPTDSMRGDSLQCRILYLNIGEQSMYHNAKQEFCPHAGEKSKMCSDSSLFAASPCEDYCDWDDKFCGPHRASQSERKACLTHCRALSPEQLQ